METQPNDSDLIWKLERLVRHYKQGVFTLLESRSRAIQLMPEGKAAEPIARLPQDLVISVKERVTESASWSEDVWESLFGIKGPEPTPSQRRQYRRKLDELRACFGDQLPN